VLLGAACREPSATRAEAAGGVSSVELRATGTPGAAGSAPVPQIAAAEVTLANPPDPRAEPPDPPLQRLAFTQERFAQLVREELLVRQLPGLRVVARVAAPGARNLVAGVGGDFVVVGSQHVYRLGAQDQRAEVLAPVPRLGPTTILPAADTSDHFWLQYEGISSLPEFDLQEAVLTPYVSVLGWTQLADFDGRALLSLGDGGFVYTTPRGVLRKSADGGAQLLLPSPARRVWRLLRGARGLWVASADQLQRLSLDGAAPAAANSGQPSQQLALPPRSVALSSQAGDVAVLAVEGFEAGKVQLRIEVHAQAAAQPRVLRWEEPQPRRADAGASAESVEFAPELSLAPGRPWVAAFGYELSVFDWRTGLRLFPAALQPARSARRPVQNLAPRAQ
jgi:hypothetical protein